MANARRKTNSIEKLLSRSGNRHHVRVVNVLRKLGWDVLVSPYYSDSFTDKPREIDVIAQRQTDVQEFGGKWVGTIDIRLFIECKYINGETIFWFDTKDRPNAEVRVRNDTKLEAGVVHSNPLTHHYLGDDTVAKLFHSSNSRGDEAEPMHKAINQILNATVYHRPTKSGLFLSERNSVLPMLRRLPYPIIVVNSFENFYRTNMKEDEEVVEQITEPFQLEVNYAFVSTEGHARNEYFLIDVVSLDSLPSLLSNIERTDLASVRNKELFVHRVAKSQGS